ncbi:MAG: PorV/PorQ family protein [Calditrichaeota bacterium]|nr:PorV/PorQ family protein [Calditrichota bacterium]RQW04082.1 MAG: PorV/PorQ family protein [Calditrichota bacterium]
MKRTGHFSIIIFLSLLVFNSGFTQQSSQEVSSINRVGTTAATFLKIAAGARPIGMGGAYTALATDVMAVYWNPAGLSRIIGQGEAFFNHAEWLAETDYDVAAFSLNIGKFGAVALHVISFRTPEEIVRTIDSPEGTGQKWDANMISLGASYAINLTDRFSIGFTGKFIQETIFNVSAKGGAVDMGILYQTPLKGLTLGASITNFGSKMRLDGRDLYFNHDPLSEPGAVSEVPGEYRMEKHNLPLNLRFGLAYKAITTEDIQLLAVIDGSQPNDNSEHINSGMELGIRNILFLRTGYKSLFLEDSEQGLTFGAGLKYNIVGTSLKFDFGWADYGRLENVQFVTFSLRY